MEKYGIMLNEDPNHFIAGRAKISDQIDQDYLESFINQYEGTNVTDMLMCVNSAFPSKFVPCVSDKYRLKEQFGRPVDYTEHPIIKTAYVIWEEKKLDMYHIWINQCRKVGIRPWLSFRMNDAHGLLIVPGALHNDFFYDHIHEYSRVRHRRQFQHWDRCRDYAFPQVREHYLDYIAETLERYDPYGIEIDFQRELDCFRLGEESKGLEIMTGFMREVKAIVKIAEGKWGHEIKIAVRCHQNPSYCIELGFDVVSWAQEGLFDLYVATARWESTDNDMPIRLWKQILTPYRVEVAGGVEVLLRPYPGYLAPNGSITENTLDTVMGSAANIFSQGADKLYLYNYMDHPEQMLFGEFREPTQETYPATGANGRVYYKLLTTAGTPDKAIHSRRRHVVTYQDHNPVWRSSGAQLPLELKSADDPKFIRIATGQIPTGRKVIVKLGIREEIIPQSELEIYVNSKPVVFIGTERSENPTFTPSPVHCFLIENNGELPEYQVVELFAKNKPFTVDFAEIVL